MFGNRYQESFKLNQFKEKATWIPRQNVVGTGKVPGPDNAGYTQKSSSA